MIKIKNWEQAFRFTLLGIIFLSFIPNGYSQVTLTNVTISGGNINMTIPSLTAESVTSNSSGVAIDVSNAPSRQLDATLPNPSMVLNLTLNYFNSTKADFSTIPSLPNPTYLNVSTTTLYQYYVDGILLNKTTGQWTWYPTTAQNKGNVTNGTDINTIFSSTTGLFHQVVRSNDTTQIYITVLRPSGGAFDMSIITLLAPNSTSNINYSNVDYIQQTIATPTTKCNNYYISGSNPFTNILFTDASLGDFNTFCYSMQILNSGYGGYIGVPIGVFFLVMVGSLANRRTAPMWVVIVLAMAAILIIAGFFTVDPGVWALALIAGLLALFVGRKIF